jgi:hypothetical protein
MKEIDDQNQHEEELYKQLSTSPQVDLTGIVSSRGVSAAKSRGQKLWSLLLSFDAWRISGKVIRTEPSQFAVASQTINYGNSSQSLQPKQLSKFVPVLQRRIALALSKPILKSILVSLLIPSFKHMTIPSGYSLAK